MGQKAEDTHSSWVPCYYANVQHVNGGVDLLDKMCYKMCDFARSPMRAKRWYMYIFWHTVKMAAVNAWFLHKCHAQKQDNSTMPLPSFLSELTNTLGPLQRACTWTTI